MALLDLEVKSAGGDIELYIERLSNKAANLKYFTIVITDKQDKEVYNISLAEKEPMGKSENGNWYNYSKIQFPDDTKKEFHVWIFDGYELKSGAHQFLIKKNK